LRKTQNAANVGSPTSSCCYLRQLGGSMLLKTARSPSLGLAAQQAAV